MRLPVGGRLAVLLALLFVACYGSDVPVDPTPQANIDAALLGTWRCLPSDPDASAEAATLTVGQASDRVYAITFSESGEKAQRYEAHASLVKGATLLNVKDLDPRFPVDPWTFARYSFLLPDLLRVQIVADKLLEGVEESPASLRQALEQFHGDPVLYVDLMICLRVRQEPREGAKD